MDKLSLDWFSCTFRCTLDNHIGYALDLIRSITGDNEIEWLQYSRLRGYNSCGTVLNGLGLVGVSDRLEMGVHFSLSASALGVLASRFGNVDIDGEMSFDFIRFVKNIINSSPPEFYTDMSDKPYVNVSRSDFALDDNSGLLSMSYIEECAINKFNGTAPYGLTTRFKNPPLLNKSLGGPGATIYFGSSASAARIRFYDKSAEKKLEGFHWVRCEIQLRDDRADTFCRVLDSASDVGRLVLSYLDFKDLYSSQADSNYSRLVSASWWQEFLGVSDKLRLGAGQAVRKVSDIVSHIEKQYAATLAILADTVGESTISRIISDGRSRLRKKHLDMIAQYKEMFNTGMSDLLSEVMSLGGVIVSDNDDIKKMTELKRQKNLASMIASISDGWSVRLLRRKVEDELELNRLLGYDAFPGDRVIGARWNLAGIDFVVDC